MDLSRPLAIACFVLGLGIYLLAVSGALFAEATPPLDVGAVSTLVCFVLFGAYALMLPRPAKAAKA